MLDRLSPREKLAVYGFGAGVLTVVVALLILR
jgi:hypothetical protein